MLLKQMPPGWSPRILMPEAGEAKSRFVVNFEGKALPEKTVRNIMLQLGLPIWGVEELKGCQLLEVPSSADMEKLINLRKLTLDGCRVNFAQVRRRWQAVDIFNCVRSELRVEAESRTISNSLWEGGGKGGRGAGWRSSDPRSYPKNRYSVNSTNVQDPYNASSTKGQDVNSNRLQDQAMVEA